MTSHRPVITPTITLFVMTMSEGYVVAQRLQGKELSFPTGKVYKYETSAYAALGKLIVKDQASH